ncbi:MAG: hypothetical protein BAJALOKI3v1_370003 [Promethearchaeota archaeon]|nr:MAG: hypothetical protein BAJALOKI3v1_370003 [Candidatus Lokiarchaeota archaeon]
MITLVLGTITAYVGTGDLAAAGGVALLTEAVQSVNYFIYEMIWSHFEERRLRREIEKEIMSREIEMRIDYNFLRDLSYEMSQMDTFVAEVYNSILDFYNRMLKNEELKDIHDEILKHKEHFKKVHEGRNFPKREDLEDFTGLAGEEEEEEEKDEETEEEKEGEEQKDEKEEVENVEMEQTENAKDEEEAST